MILRVGKYTSPMDGMGLGASKKRLDDSHDCSGMALHVVVGIMILGEDAAVGQQHDMVHPVCITKASPWKKTSS